MYIEILSKIYTVTSDMTIDQLKMDIENKTFLPANSYVLYNGSQAMLTGSISTFNLDEYSLLDTHILAEDGMRAKWRKKRMRHLRRKRRKMRQRAR